MIPLGLRKPAKAPIVDPYWDQVELLLPLSSDYADVSPRPKTVNFEGVGDPITADQSVWGTKSFAAEHGACLLVPLAIGETVFSQLDGDFTIEGWFRYNNSALLSTAKLFSVHHDDTAFRWYFRGYTSGNFWLYNREGGSGVPSCQGWYHSLAINEWTFLTLGRYGNNYVCSQDGLFLGLCSSTVGLNQTASVNPGTFGIGWDYLDSADFTGHYQDIRVTKGVYRYFQELLDGPTHPVPTKPFPYY